MIAWLFGSLALAGGPTGVEAWMSRCYGGDAEACDRLSIAAAYEEARSVARSKEVEAATALDQWALSQRCRAGEVIACVAIERPPAACGLSWTACKDALKVGGAKELPVVIATEPLKFDVSDAPLIDPAIARRVTVHDALPSEKRLALLLSVRIDDPSHSFLFAPDWRYGIAELRRGRWTTRSLPNLPDLQWDWGDEPQLLEAGGVLFAHGDALVEWTPEGTAVPRAELWPDRGHEGSWDVAGSRVLVRHERSVVRLDLETSATETWDAGEVVMDSAIADDGTAWMVVGGQLLRWAPDEATPRAVAVEPHRVVDRHWTLQEAGPIEHVWAGPDGSVVVEREPRYPLFWLDRDGHPVFRGGSAGAPSFGLAWDRPEPTPGWARKRPPLSMPLAPDVSVPTLRLRVVDRLGNPLYPASVHLGPVSRSREDTPRESGETAPDGTVSLYSPEWTGRPAGERIAIEVTGPDGVRREVETARSDAMVVRIVRPDVRAAPGSWTVVAVAAGVPTAWTEARGETVTPGDPLAEGALLYAIDDAGIARAEQWADLGDGKYGPVWAPLPLTSTAITDGEGRPRPGVDVEVSFRGHATVLASYIVTSDANGMVDLPAETPIAAKHSIRVGATRVPSAPALDVDATPTSEAMRDLFVGRWLVPTTTSEWIVAAKGRNLSVRRDGEPMRVLGQVGAELWVTPGGPGPRGIWKLKGGDPDLLVLTTGSGYDTAFTVLQRQPSPDNRER